MAYQLKINDTDVSNFINDVSEIQVFGRNPDYSITAEGYNFTLSKSSFVTASKNDNVYVYSGSVLLHNGYISDIVEDVGEYSHHISVEHQFIKLREIFPASDYTGSFKEVMEPYIQYIHINDENPGSDRDYRMISHISAMAAIINMADITVDSTLISNNRSVTWEAMRGTYTATFPGTYVQEPVTFDTDKLFLLADQLFCVGQDKVLTVDTIETAPSPPQTITDYKAKRISLWDILVALSMILKLNFIPKDEGSYYYIWDEPFNMAEFPHNITYDLQTQKFNQRADSVTFSYKTLNHRITDWWHYDGNRAEFYWFPYVISGWWIPHYYETINGREWREDNDENAPYRVVIDYENGEGTGTNTEQIKWYNHLDLIYLSQLNNPNPQIIWLSAKKLYSPFSHITNVLLSGGTKYTLQTDANYMLSDVALYGNNNFQSVVVDSIEDDTLTIEYLEF